MTFARARALAILGVVAIAAVVLVVTALVRDKQSGFLGGRCGPGDVRISTKLPPQSSIKLNVFNGTAVSNLAGRVAEALQAQGFPINKVGDMPQRFDHVARLSYGPKAVGAAAVVRGYFLNKADPGGFDMKRTDDLVDLTLGSAFTKLGSKTEVSQAWAALGQPQAPPGTCDDGVR
jgi:hypothetical protein